MREYIFDTAGPDADTFCTEASNEELKHPHSVIDDLSTTGNIFFLLGISCEETKLKNDMLR